jgi:hypothetical protein
MMQERPEGGRVQASTSEEDSIPMEQRTVMAGGQGAKEARWRGQ